MLRTYVILIFDPNYMLQSCGVALGQVFRPQLPLFAVDLPGQDNAAAPFLLQEAP